MNDDKKIALFVLTLCIGTFIFLGVVFWVAIEYVKQLIGVTG